jgi:hypothetical protein
MNKWNLQSASDAPSIKSRQQENADRWQMTGNPEVVCSSVRLVPTNALVATELSTSIDWPGTGFWGIASNESPILNEMVGQPQVVGVAGRAVSTCGLWRMQLSPPKTDNKDLTGRQVSPNYAADRL